MELEHSFTVPVPKDRAWDVLLDVERVAPCMPGATLDSVDGDEIHGKIKVKVGPITMTYAGVARFVERDPVTGVVTLEASGKETRGAGTASASVRSVLEDRGDETHVTVLTTLNVTGKPAQFGRGVMNEVGGKLLTIFATNLATTLAEPAAPVPAEAGATAGAMSGAEATVAAPLAAAPAVTPVGAATPAPPMTPAPAVTPVGAATPAPPTTPAPELTPAQVSLDAPLDDLAMPTRLRESLRRGGITTIGELAAKTSENLLELTGIGPSSVEDIRTRLAERGLTLGHPPAPAVPTGATPGVPAGAAADAIPPALVAADAITAPPAHDAIPPDTAPAAAIPPSPVQPNALTAGNGARPGATTTTRSRPDAAKAADAEPEAINLLKVAGLPMLKRALPVLAGLTAALVIALRHRMRRRRRS